MMNNSHTFSELLVLKDFPHTSHTYLISWPIATSEWWVFLCRFNDCLVLYAWNNKFAIFSSSSNKKRTITTLSQFSASQENCFLSDLSLWHLLMCRLSPDHLLNTFPQISQTHGFRPKCWRRWPLRRCLLKNFLPHLSHVSIDFLFELSECGSTLSVSDSLSIVSFASCSCRLECDISVAWLTFNVPKDLTRLRYN